MSPERTTTVRLSADQVELLTLSAAAYEQRMADGQKQTIGFYSSLGAPTTAEHPGLPGGAMAVDLGDLDELDGYGLIDITYSRRGDHSGTYRVTNDGYDAVEQIEEHKRAIARSAVVPEEGKGTGLDWQQEVYPVLKAVYDVYSCAPSSNGVSQDAIRQELGGDAPEHLGLILGKLQQADYVRKTLDYDQLDGPAFCEPTPKALELLAGWPTERGDVALARLIEVLEARIQATDDPEEKTRLERLRNSVKDVPQRVMTSVLTDLIMKGGGGLIG